MQNPYLLTDRETGDWLAIIMQNEKGGIEVISADSVELQTISEDFAYLIMEEEDYEAEADE